MSLEQELKWRADQNKEEKLELGLTNLVNKMSSYLKPP